MNVVQSVEDNTPLFVAEAVGTFKVITGVVVPFATLLLKSVPVVPNVKAATLVTEPLPLLLNVVQSAELNAPRFVADAVGRLNVWVSVTEEIAKSVPLVPTAKY